MKKKFSLSRSRVIREKQYQRLHTMANGLPWKYVQVQIFLMVSREPELHETR